MHKLVLPIIPNSRGTGLRAPANDDGPRESPLEVLRKSGLQRAPGAAGLVGLVVRRGSEMSAGARNAPRLLSGSAWPCCFFVSLACIHGVLLRYSVLRTGKERRSRVVWHYDLPVLGGRIACAIRHVTARM